MAGRRAGRLRRPTAVLGRAIAVAGAIGVLASARSLLGVIDDQPGHGAEPLNSLTEAQAVSLGDS